MAKQKSVQIWKFTPSQTLLIKEQARIHDKEAAPLVNYQARSQHDLLMQFKEELNIPESVLLTVDLDTHQFTERQPSPQEVGPLPVPVDDSPSEEEPAAE